MNENIELKRQLDSIANAFEAAWKKGKQSIEQFLAVNPNYLPREQVLKKLIPLEMELRLGAGELNRLPNEFGTGWKPNPMMLP